METVTSLWNNNTTPPQLKTATDLKYTWPTCIENRVMLLLLKPSPHQHSTLSSSSSSVFMVSVRQTCLHLIRASMSIMPVLKNTLRGPQNKGRRRGQVGEEGETARSSIIRYYDLTLMCSPHVAVLRLLAPQHDMTAPLELLKHKSLMAGAAETGGGREWKKKKKIGGRKEGYQFRYKMKSRMYESFQLRGKKSGRTGGEISFTALHFF